MIRIQIQYLLNSRLIIEVNLVMKKKAMKFLAKLHPEAHFEYKVIYTKDAFLHENLDEMQKIREWIYRN